jgi:hypothetical protein
VVFLGIEPFVFNFLPQVPTVTDPGTRVGIYGQVAQVHKPLQFVSFFSLSLRFLPYIPPNSGNAPGRQARLTIDNRGVLVFFLLPSKPGTSVPGETVSPSGYLAKVSLNCYLLG